MALLLAGDGILSRGCRPTWVKVNRQLVEGLACDPQRQTWLKGLVTQLRQDGVFCIAEGIESVVEPRCLKGVTGSALVWLGTEAASTSGCHS